MSPATTTATAGVATAALGRGTEIGAARLPPLDTPASWGLQPSTADHQLPQTAGNTLLIPSLSLSLSVVDSHIQDSSRTYNMHNIF